MNWRVEKAFWVTLSMVLINIVAGMVLVYCTKIDYLKCFCIQLIFVVVPTYFVSYGAIEDAVKSIIRRKSK